MAEPETETSGNLGLAENYRQGHDLARLQRLIKELPLATHRLRLVTLLVQDAIDHPEIFDTGTDSKAIQVKQLGELIEVFPASISNFLGAPQVPDISLEQLGIVVTTKNPKAVPHGAGPVNGWMPTWKALEVIDNAAAICEELVAVLEKGKVPNLAAVAHTNRNINQLSEPDGSLKAHFLFIQDKANRIALELGSGLDEPEQVHRKISELVVQAARLRKLCKDFFATFGSLDVVPDGEVLVARHENARPQTRACPEGFTSVLLPGHRIPVLEAVLPDTSVSDTVDLLKGTFDQRGIPTWLAILIVDAVATTGSKPVFLSNRLTGSVFGLGDEGVRKVRANATERYGLYHPGQPKKLTDSIPQKVLLGAAKVYVNAANELRKGSTAPYSSSVWDHDLSNSLDRTIRSVVNKAASAEERAELSEHFDSVAMALRHLADVRNAITQPLDLVEISNQKPQQLQK